MRGEIERYGGIVEFAGDGVMGVFGAPVAHEDDPQRAAHAALAMRESATALGDDLRLRIGVNTGEVLARVGAIASGESLAGDAINTASRLEGAAEPGEILVGEQTYLATRDDIEYEAAEPVRAKGKAEPVPCWRAMAPRSLLPEDIRDEVPFLGRAAERARLAAAFEESAQGRTRLLLITGEAGIGKSRLVAELRRIAAETPRLTTWRRGRVAPYGDRSAFGALGEIVAQQAGILASDDAVAVAGRKLDAAVAGAGLRGTDAVWVRRHLGPLLGLPSAGGPARREEAMAAWRLFLEAVARRGPAVIVLEDLHHADPALLDFVEDLVEPAPEVGLLVVVTARPSCTSAAPAGRAPAVAERIDLGPLERAAVEELLHHLADAGDLPPEEAARARRPRRRQPAVRPRVRAHGGAARRDARPRCRTRCGGSSPPGSTRCRRRRRPSCRTPPCSARSRGSAASRRSAATAAGRGRGAAAPPGAPAHPAAPAAVVDRGRDRAALPARPVPRRRLRRSDPRGARAAARARGGLARAAGRRPHDGIEHVAHHRWTAFEARRALGEDVPELRDATRGSLRGGRRARRRRATTCGRSCGTSSAR